MAASRAAEHVRDWDINAPTMRFAGKVDLSVGMSRSWRPDWVRPLIDDPRRALYLTDMRRQPRWRFN